jgi:hypothetical protein
VPGRAWKKRLLFDWIAVQGAHVPVGDHQLAAAVVTHLAYARETFGNRTGVPAGIAPHAVPVECFIQLALASLFGKMLGQRLHRRALIEMGRLGPLY